VYALDPDCGRATAGAQGVLEGELGQVIGVGGRGHAVAKKKPSTVQTCSS
jgi:hypothetical protein